MKIDHAGFGPDLADAGGVAAQLEASGYHGAFTTETGIDPFLPLAVAATTTSRLALSTAIAVAFSRSPMSIATSAYNLHVASQGRMTIGLGSQVQAHIEHRYSMPWSRPAHRMSEYVTALRAIWLAFDREETIDFQGQFYSFSVLPPNFRPAPSPWGSPRVAVAAVGPRMTETAGEVADEVILHSLTSTRYMREVTLPALARGRVRACGTRPDVKVSLPVLVATGRDEVELATARASVAQRVAFYASTPAYRGVLDVHGWGDLQPKLASLVAQGEWSALGALIADDVLNEFAVVGAPETLAGEIAQRYGDMVDRVSVVAPYTIADDVWQGLLDAFGEHNTRVR